ncbi:hypothetical protein MMC19_001041 [Ptychographa xylographoides]|nr:hypothetical protein [Ptychographa xylographoides]
MGNCFGKEEKSSGAFTTPGRTIGDAPASPALRATVPPKLSGPGRSLGGGTVAVDASDARSAAARAAEERAARANQPRGKLGQALATQKQQTRTGTLGNVSQNERRARDADAGAEARNWN